MTQTVMTPLRQRMLDDMKLRNMAVSTRKIYVSSVAGFSAYHGRSPDELTLEDVRDYQLHLVARGLKASSICPIMSALRFFYGTTLGNREAAAEIPLPRKADPLPAILSQDEVKRLLTAVPDQKMRTLLTTVYAAGLRVSEVEGRASVVRSTMRSIADYTRRPQTVTDHARQLAVTLGLRMPTAADLPLMIEAAAQAASGTDCGQPITGAVVAALRAASVILPVAAVIERAAIAGRARARRRATDALLTGLPDEQLAKLDKLPVLDPSVGMTPFAWLKAVPVAPKAEHVRELLDRLRLVRGIGLPPELAGEVSRGTPAAVHPDWARRGRPAARPLLGAPAARDPGRDRPRSGDSPDRRGAGHGR